MKNAFLSLFDSIFIAFCGAGAVIAASARHWGTDAAWVATALMLASVSFTRYKKEYVRLPKVSPALGKAQHYALELLKSFILFTCGEGVVFSFMHHDILTVSLWVICAVLLFGLVLARGLALGAEGTTP